MAIVRPLSGVFVNYRVGDAQNEAAFLADQLVRRFGSGRVFFASRSIPVGSKFADEIRAGLARCSVLVAVIGPRWLDATDRDGSPRLSAPDDWVRAEIAAAIELGLEVVPVLLDGGTPTARPTADQLPADIRALADRQYLRLNYRSLDVDDVVDRLVGADPGLLAGAVFTTLPPLPRDPMPSMLLRAEYGVVPFHGRRAELADLDAWCSDGPSVAARLMTGPGGQGSKTRLATELCSRLTAAGWTAGLVAESATPADMVTLSGTRRPLLLVFDYAESRRTEVVRVASNLTAASRGAPARLLLLSRGAGDWLRELREDADDHVRSLFPDGVERPLRSLTRKVAGRQDEFGRALAAFIPRLEDPNPAPVAPADLDGDRFDRVLDLHAAALATLLDDPGAAEPGPTVSDPVDRVLDHERRYWRRTLSGHGLDAADRDQLNTVVAVATLYSPGRTAAREILLGSDEFTGLPRNLIDRYLSWSAELYPGPAALNPLRPDRIGEDHVAAVVGRQPDLTVRPLPHLDDSRLLQALTVLGRAVARHGHLEEPIRALIAADPARLLRLGMTVATQLDSPAALAGILRAALNARPDDDLVRVVAGHLPQRSTALADLDVLATRLTLDTARRRAELNPAVTARLLVRHANGLLRTGRPVEAEPLAREAQVMLVDLAATDPDQHRPDLARALNVLAVALAEQGRQDDSVPVLRTAIALRRALADQDAAAHLPELASALSTLSVDLGELGAAAESLDAITEAVDVHRRLAREHSQLHRAGLASALNNLSLHLGAARRLEESVAAISEAVGVERSLAADQPDAHLPELARSLDNLAIGLDRCGRSREALEPAEESLDIRRALVDLDDVTYAPGLAAALTNYSVVLGHLGLTDDAIAAVQEAVTTCRALTDVFPDRFRPHLATALTGLANRLGEAGRTGEAVDAATEVLSLCTVLSERRPEVHLPSLVQAQSNLAVALARAQRHDDALPLAEAAIRSYRLLVRREPGTWRPLLAGTLLNHAASLLLVGRPEPALASIEESVQLFRTLAERHPGPHLPDLVRSLLLEGRILERLGRSRAAVQQLVEAVGAAHRTESQTLITRARGTLAEVHARLSRSTDDRAETDDA